MSSVGMDDAANQPLGVRDEPGFAGEPVSIQ
jgi:hypothetical protein